jgi:hypothetical protein
MPEICVCKASVSYTQADLDEAVAKAVRERTKEIAETWWFADVGLHNADLEDELKRAYPDCFTEDTP